MQRKNAGGGFDESGINGLGRLMEVLVGMPVGLLVVPVLATLAGGVAAIRMERWRHALVAVSAGLLLGAAFLDLLPEAVELGAGAGLRVAEVLGITLGFFLAFSALEAWIGERGQGRVGGWLLIFHSFRDGMAIGAAFAASHAAGYAVAAGIAAHDFGDGMNTVIVTSSGGKAGRAVWGFLVLDALAPFAGGMLTVWWMVSSRSGAVLLALAAAFFLQMATGDFLPAVRARRGWGLGGVALGAGVIWVTNWLMGVR